MDPQDNLKAPDAADAWRLKGRLFIPIWERYADAAKTVIGLSAGSITLLAGFVTYISASSASRFHAINIRGPVVGFALSICYLLAFLVVLTTRYEDYLVRVESYTRFWYSLANALCWAGFICFGVAYLWLAFLVVRLDSI